MDAWAWSIVSLLKRMEGEGTEQGSLPRNTHMRTRSETQTHRDTEAQIHRHRKEGKKRRLRRCCPFLSFLFSLLPAELHSSLFIYLHSHNNTRVI